MKHVAIICVIAIASCVSLSWADERQPDELETVVQEGDFSHGPNVQQIVEGIKLYDRIGAARSAAERKLRADHPELFSTAAVIAYWGSPSCRPCIPQKRILKAHVDKYNIVFYDTSKVKDAELLILFGHDLASPQILILEQGKITAKFRGYTPWKKIKPRAKKARKPDPEINGRDRLFDGKILKKLRDRLKDRNRQGLLDRLEGLRETLLGWWDTASAWVTKYWDEIVRIAIILFMLM